MKIYAITITPQSPFGTPLKGDTLFGQFCWQAAEDNALLTDGLDAWLSRYDETPFAIFSTAWPVIAEQDSTWIAVPRPPLPDIRPKPVNRREKILRHKDDKKKKWLLLDATLTIDMQEERLKTDHELFEMFLASQDQKTAATLDELEGEQRRLAVPVTRMHNTINRLSHTTGTGMFAPYSHENHQYLPGLNLVVFAAVDEKALDADRLKAGFDRMGAWGFGRDASTGLGRFSVNQVRALDWPVAQKNHNACYTLGPCVPQKKTFARRQATPFTRFGKHGVALASKNPFKQPVVMADEGALLYPAQRQQVFSRPWTGTAIRGISVSDKRTVMQGYSLYLPC